MVKPCDYFYIFYITTTECPCSQERTVIKRHCSKIKEVLEIIMYTSLHCIEVTKQVINAVAYRKETADDLWFKSISINSVIIYCVCMLYCISLLQKCEINHMYF